MSAKSIGRPGLTAAMTVGRELLAAGWRYDSTTQLAPDIVERQMLHPSGAVITAHTSGDGERTELTLAPLSLEQVAGAIRGAGLVPAPATQPPAATSCPRDCGVDVAQHRSTDLINGACDVDYWHRAATELHRAADHLATLAGTTGKPQSANLYLSVGHSWDDPAVTVPVVDAIAAAFGTTAATKVEGRGQRRSAEHRTNVNLGPLQVVAYAGVPTPLTEAEKRGQTRAALEAENAALRAELAAATQPAMGTTGGAA